MENQFPDSTKPNLAEHGTSSQEAGGHLGIVDVLVQRLQLVVRVIHLDEDCLQEHFHLVHVVIIAVVSQTTIPEKPLLSQWAEMEGADIVASKQIITKSLQEGLGRI